MAILASTSSLADGIPHGAFTKLSPAAFWANAPLGWFLTTSTATAPTTDWQTCATFALTPMVRNFLTQLPSASAAFAPPGRRSKQLQRRLASLNPKCGEYAMASIVFIGNAARYGPPEPHVRDFAQSRSASIEYSTSHFAGRPFSMLTLRAAPFAT
jgi:hypothetical protein